MVGGQWDEVSNLAKDLISLWDPPATPMESNSDPVTEEKAVVCKMCSSTASTLDIDTLHDLDNIPVHYFCLLFSSGLCQRGTEAEGIRGFLSIDIKREIKRGARLKCSYCRLAVLSSRDNLWCHVDWCAHVGLQHARFTRNFGQSKITYVPPSFICLRRTFVTATSSWKTCCLIKEAATKQNQSQ